MMNIPKQIFLLPLMIIGFIIVSYCIGDKTPVEKIKTSKISFPNSQINEHIQYRYVEDSGSSILRHWNSRYWDLQISGRQGLLSFTESDRGIESFSIQVDVVKANQKIYLKFDSLCFMPFHVFSKIDCIKKGDLLMEFDYQDSILKTNSDFLNITRKRNEKQETKEFKRMKYEPKSKCLK